MDQDDKPTTEEVSPLPPLRAADHGSLPIALPNLEHLTSVELASLRSYVTSQVKDARKRSNQLLNKDESLRKLWMNTISFKPGTTEAERKTALDEFQRALLRKPAAYVAYGFVTSLFVVEEAVRNEMLRRSKNP